MAKSECLGHNDSLMAFKDAIKEVKRAFIDIGDPKASEKCLDGCVGLIYALVNQDQAGLFDCLFLSHGHKFIGAKISSIFYDHYLVIAKDRQEKWMAASPANFDIPISADSEILQANSSSELQDIINEQIGGFWVPPGMVSPESREYSPPKIIFENGQQNLEVTLMEWSLEYSGLYIVTHQVNLFS